MSYHFSKTLEGSFEDVKEKVTAALKEKGFGVLTEISINETLKKKLDVDFKPYHILGACNPGYAHKALQAEDKIGLMLPCNVIITEAGEGKFEVSAIDPAASMQAISNDELMNVAGDVQNLLKEVIEEL
jgi:uncharacterized protein (DUF302 family)